MKLVPLFDMFSSSKMALASGYSTIVNDDPTKGRVGIFVLVPEAPAPAPEPKRFVKPPLSEKQMRMIDKLYSDPTPDS